VHVKPRRSRGRAKAGARDIRARKSVDQAGLTDGRWSAKLPAGDACGAWDGLQDRVHFFELSLDLLPRLRLDHREIVAVRLFSLDELRDPAVTGPVAANLERRR
jgi:hypothetical protein